jgi:Leucine-rich repeat (LRR) protein
LKSPSDKSSSDKSSKEPSGRAKEAIEIIKKLSGTYKLSSEGELTLINVDGAAMTPDMFDVFGKQVEVETLQVANFRGLNDAVFSKISGLKKLKTLSATNATITDVSAAFIEKSFPSIRNLDLSRNAYLTDGALSHLGKLNELESLVINYCTFSEFGLMNIEKLPKLRALDIRGNVNISASAIGVIAKMPAIRSLKHMSNMVDDGAIAELVGAKNLDTLDMYDFSITDAAGEYLNKLPKLSSLVIFRCSNFGSQGLLALKEKPLKRLTLRDLAQLDDSGMEAFRSMKTLKRLYLHELNSVSDTGMSNLESLQELETLDIWSMPMISDKSIELISKLPKLKSLSIRSTGITDKSVDLILKLPKLEELILKDNAAISETAKAKLKESKKFKTLTLDSIQK